MAGRRGPADAGRGGGGRDRGGAARARGAGLRGRRGGFDGRQRGRAVGRWVVVAERHPDEETAAGNTACAGLFCEDFERGVIDPAIWDIKVNGGQAPPDVVTQAGLVGAREIRRAFSRRSQRGELRLHDHQATARGAERPPFGRAYFMITPMPPTNHTEYIYAGTTGFPAVQVPRGRQRGAAGVATHLREPGPARHRRGLSLRRQGADW